jgi:peroxiredoxin
MPIEVGQEAPDFTLKDQNGSEVTLSSFRGSKNVVIVFYPFSFTGTCTGELCEIRDHLEAFENDDTVTVAISCDSPFTQKIFALQESYTFPVLSDFWPHGATAIKYGVFLEDKGAATRGSFIVDKDGIVRWTVIHGLGEARDRAEYEKVLASL